MKAITITSPGDIRMIEVEKPKVGTQDILCKVKYAGICGTDMSILSGETGLVSSGLVKYPVRIGHEWSGIIEEIGSEVTGFKVGDKVTADTGVSCGECLKCLKGDYHLCPNGRAVGTVSNYVDGAMAEYMIMPSRHVFKIPDNVSLEEAALIEPASIAYHGIQRAGILPGANVLVIGTGSIGLAAVSLCKIKGASNVLLSGRRDTKLNIGKKMGADQLINSVKNDFIQEVKNKTRGEGVDIILETSGNIQTINQSIDLINDGGTISLIGFYESELNNIDIDKLILRNITITGIAGTPSIFPIIIKLLQHGQLSLKPLITERYDFDNYLDAFNAVKENNSNRIKILIES